MNIPIFKLEFEEEFLDKYQELSLEILTSDRPLSEGKYVNLFEQKFAKFIGSKYAIAVSNGTAAIELVLKAVDVKGKTVISPTNTFFATTVAITNSGAKIVLVDCEEESFSISPDHLRLKIKECRKKKEEIGAVIIVHVGGIISHNIEQIKLICEEYKIPLVEDAAHAHGSYLGKNIAGNIGIAGCFSFFPTKVMTTGEGGMITTNDKKLYEQITSLKNFGRDNNNPGIIINPMGNNFKMTEMTALLGNLELDRVERRIKKRNSLTQIYTNRLKGSNYIPVLQKKDLSSQYKMILRTNIKTDWLKKYCKQHGIALTGEVYKIPIHEQPLYRSDFTDEKFPVADAICKSHICPPLYPELTNSEINYICDILLQAEREYEK